MQLLGLQDGGKGRLAWSLALEGLEAPGPPQLCGTTAYGILWLTGCFAAG